MYLTKNENDILGTRNLVSDAQLVYLFVQVKCFSDSQQLILTCLYDDTQLKKAVKMLEALDFSNLNKVVR